MTPYVFPASNPLIWRDPSGRFGIMDVMVTLAVIGVLEATAMPSFMRFIGAVQIRGSGKSENLASEGSATVMFEKDVLGRYIITDQILRDQADFVYKTFLNKPESNPWEVNPIKLSERMGIIDTVFYDISDPDGDLRSSKFVYAGAYGGMVEFTAEQVNYIGVGMGFAHFNALGDFVAAQTMVQGWNVGKHGHMGSAGEHYWTEIGVQLYADMSK
jgi:hypothetical protein